MKIETNEEFMNRLMTFSKHGALMQLFILSALEFYSEKVQKLTEEQFPDDHIIAREAWKGCATEFLTEFETRNKVIGRRR